MWDGATRAFLEPHGALPSLLRWLRPKVPETQAAKAKAAAAAAAESAGEAEGAGAAVRGVLRGLVGAAARRARQLLVPVGTGLS